MMIDVFYKRGDMSASRGLFVNVISYNDDFFDEPVFIGNRITEEEYHQLLELFELPDVKRGWDGIVNDEGYAKYLSELEQLEVGE